MSSLSIATPHAAPSGPNALDAQGTIELPASLSARDAEVLADRVSAFLSEGTVHFRFVLVAGFLPTLGWLNHLREVLRPLLEQKKTVEISGDAEQGKSLRAAGFHLISDISQRKPSPR
jgi:hypothetical protein